MTTLRAFATGVYFALLQIGSFLVVESVASSAWTTYALLTAAWMVGTLVGLGRAIPARFGVVLGLVAFEALAWGTRLAPWSPVLVPFGAVTTGLGGVWAGAFFVRTTAERRVTADRLFFHENNGFGLGIVVATLLFAFGGRMALAIGPVILGVTLLMLDAEPKPAKSAGP